VYGKYEWVFYASVEKILLFFSFDSRTGDPENPDLWSEPTVFGQVSILSLKGKCHEMDIVFEGLNSFISTFRVCDDGLQGLSKAFH
jgi:hypothetical protein